MMTRFILLLCLACLTPCYANMANPWDGSDPVGEPVAALQDLHVIGETLKIDASALSSGHQVIGVEASYQVENRGVSRTVPLQFMGLDMSQVVVRLDGRELAGEPVELTPETIPENWDPPNEVKALEGQGYVEYLGELQAVRFEAPLEPGSHHIEVHYKAQPGVYHPTDGVYRHYQFVYLLSPARAWSSFANLSVEVLLPKEFRVVDNLGMAREGDTLKGTFSELPGDVLTLSLGATGRDYGGPITGAFAVLAVLASCALSRDRVGLALSAGFLLTGAAVVMGHLVATSLLDQSQLSRSYSYGQLFLALFGTMGGACLGGAVCLVVALVRRRWGARKAPPSEAIE